METRNNTVLGFVFTNYNSSEDTKNAIQSINATMEKSIYQIVVVDNNSNEESVGALKLLERDFSNVHLILSNENVGYFKGLNLGIKYIRDNFKEISYMVIGNNDLIFPENFYNLILKNLEIFKKYPVISPNIVTREGIRQNPQVIKKISTLREIVYDLYYCNYYFAIIIKKIAELTHKFTDRNDEKDFRIPQEISQGHGSCYILGPVFFENFEQLNAPTFLMGEEFFLSLQLQRKNLSVYYVPDISVLHECHSSIAKVPNKKMWHISKKSHKEYRKYIKWI
jgi:GT2 family glycosyltransferase